MARPDGKIGVGIHLALFAATVALAAYSKWSTTDLVWSLWISSLTVGYSLILASIAGTLAHGSPTGMLTRAPGRTTSAPGQIPSAVAALPLNFFIAIVCMVTLGFAPLGVAVLGVLAASSLLAVGGVLRGRPGWAFFPDPNRGLARVIIALPAALFMLGFFTVHFGLFHFVHGLFLNGFFPLTGQAPVGKSPGDVFGLMVGCAREALMRYWPFVAASALSRLPTYAAAYGAADGSAMLTPYLNVIRMHVMIFVFGLLGAAGLQAYALYPLLVVYFLPVGDLLSLWRAKRAAGAAGDPAEPR